MTQLEIRINGIPQLQLQLAQTAKGLKDLRGALAEASEWYLTRIDDRFVNEADSDGNKWQPLSVAYRKQKSRRGGINKILQFRGRLRKIRYQVYSDRAVIGSNLPYAAIHEFGGTIRSHARSRQVEFKASKSGQSRFAKAGKGNLKRAVTYKGGSAQIPQRSFLRASAADELKIGKIVSDRISGG